MENNRVHTSNIHVTNTERAEMSPTFNLETVVALFL